MHIKMTVAECILLIDLTKERISHIRRVRALNGDDKLEGLEGDLARSELYKYEFLLSNLLR